jgi:hypothetical protein
MFQCLKQKPGSAFKFCSLEFKNLGIVSARPGAIVSVYIGFLVGASIPDLSAGSIFAGSGPGISCFEFRIFDETADRLQLTKREHFQCALLRMALVVVDKASSLDGCVAEFVLDGVHGFFEFPP